MLDDGVKAAGKDDDQMKVADISIHLLEAIEAGERKLAQQDAPVAALIASMSAGAAANADATVATFTSTAATTGATATITADAATETTPDDLGLIVGIGPALEKVLHDAGILTFEALAALTLEQLQDILPNLHDAAAENKDFIGQAAAFAQAKADGIDPASIARGGQVT